jgi:hypothetical protein
MVLYLAGMARRCCSNGRDQAHCQIFVARAESRIYEPMIVIALNQARKLRDRKSGAKLRNRRDVLQFPICVKHRYQFGATFPTRMQSLEAEMAITTCGDDFKVVPGARFAPHVAQRLAYPSPPLRRTLRDVKQKCEAESCRRESSSAPFQTAPVMPS